MPHFWHYGKFPLHHAAMPECIGWVPSVFSTTPIRGARNGWGILDESWSLWRGGRAVFWLLGPVMTLQLTNNWRKLGNCTDNSCWSSSLEHWCPILADRTAAFFFAQGLTFCITIFNLSFFSIFSRSDTIGYWYDTVVCLSVFPSVCLWRSVLWISDSYYSKSV